MSDITKNLVNLIRAEALRDAADAEQAVVAELRSQTGWGRTERCAAVGAVMGCVDRLRARADALDPPGETTDR